MKRIIIVPIEFMDILNLLLEGAGITPLPAGHEPIDEFRDVLES